MTSFFLPCLRSFPSQTTKPTNARFPQGYAYQQVLYAGSSCELLATPQERVDLLAKVLSTWQSSRGKEDADEVRNVLSELQAECEVERSPSPERVIQRRATTLQSLSTVQGSDLIYGEWSLRN